MASSSLADQAREFADLLFTAIEVANDFVDGLARLANEDLDVEFQRLLDDLLFLTDPLSHGGASATDVERICERHAHDLELLGFHIETQAEVLESVALVCGGSEIVERFRNARLTSGFDAFTATREREVLTGVEAGIYFVRDTIGAAVSSWREGQITRFHSRHKEQPYGWDPSTAVEIQRELALLATAAEIKPPDTQWLSAKNAAKLLGYSDTAAFQRAAKSRGIHPEAKHPATRKVAQSRGGNPRIEYRESELVEAWGKSETSSSA